MFTSKNYFEIKPMLAKDVKMEELDRLLDSELWIAEEKFDGERALLHLFSDMNIVSGRRVSTVTGNLTRKENSLPHFRDAVVEDLAGTIIDGELIHPKGFSMTASILGSLPERAIKLQQEHGLIRYYAFDLLYFKGTSLLNRPLIERKNLLKQVVETLNYYYNIPLYEVEFVQSGKREFMNDVLAKGGEGIILKYVDGIYEPDARRSSFTKVKRIETFDVLVTGIEYGRGKYNKNKVGALIFSVLSPVTYAIENSLSYKPYSNETVLVEWGSCAGMTQDLIEEITKNPSQYLNKVIEIECNEVLSSGKFRHPRFVRFRDDKQINDIVSVDMLKR